jgi:hypothetical protein
MSQPEVAMILVDALTGEDNTPIIVSDLRAEILEARRRRVALHGLEDLDQTDLFTLLRRLMSLGYVERQASGYVVTPDGRGHARQLREHLEGVRAIDEAAHVALTRAS